MDEFLESKLTPLQLTQLNTVKLLFKAIELDYEEKTVGYVNSTKHLVSLLWKYMPKIMRKEIKEHYNDMENKKKEIDSENLTPERKTKSINEYNKNKSDSIMDLCIKALVNSPIIEESIDINLYSEIDRDQLKKYISSANLTAIMEGETKL